jgi:hypothetical protein
MLNDNLPADARDTRELVAKVNGMIRAGKPDSEVVLAAIDGLVGLVGRLEAAMQEIDNRSAAARRQMRRM